MLKQRIMTAAILIALFILILFKFSFETFFILTALITLWGGWEWSLLIGVARFPHCFIFPFAVAMLMVVSLIFPISYILNIAIVGWLLGLGLVAIYPRGRSLWGNSVFWRAFMGILVLIPCWRAINFLRASENGPAMVLFLFALIWGADIGAYFIGRRWGKHKLCPQVSPGKTWEGLLGALAVTLCTTLIVLWPLKLPYPEWVWAIVLSVTTVLFSVLGDLFESMLKRNVNLKDSGRLLPGHGGILDRVDSLTAAAPVFAMGAVWMGKAFH